MWHAEVRALDHRDWGLREYSEALREMRELRAERRNGRIPDTLLLVEHPPVVTVGVQGAGEEVAAAGLPVVHVERGGRATYHGLGQLVGYPIVDLNPRGRDVRRFVRGVEELIIRALAECAVPTERRDGQPGVWTRDGRKIASIGIAVEEWVTFHGFALNVSTDLAEFERIHPCGMDGRVMTSVSEVRGRPADLAEMKPPIVRAWAVVFGPDAGASEPILVPTARTDRA